MKRIEIKDQLRHRIALELSDRQMAEADEKYNAVEGRTRPVGTLCRELPGNGGTLMKRYAVCAFLGALLWLPILGGAIYA